MGKSRYVILKLSRRAGRNKREVVHVNIPRPGPGFFYSARVHMGRYVDGAAGDIICPMKSAGDPASNGRKSFLGI
ncbi:MAG: hypothetical protein C6P37_02485 [Caldibacillus debilis]|uniref:Uncharacterized protein n=1 Tax=Caldibacillus debilis TaxID=301148 RepID=A0A3E0K7V6_9BACI|nr:MAG: hypothetical protein C6W56_04920 [Caldibacillus debilis]REJ30905.1 MAG: hypothetical protein C6P37_02485 [Caldibacillus debilis]